MDTWPGKDGRLSSERKYFCRARSKGKPVWDSPKIREADSRRLEHFFYLHMSVLFSSSVIQKRYLMGLAGMWCSSSFPSEAKCDGDGVGWHDGSWAQKVSHATHRPNLLFWVLHQPNLWQRTETVDIKTSGDRWPGGAEVGWSAITGSNCKGNLRHDVVKRICQTS